VHVAPPKQFTAMLQLYINLRFSAMTVCSLCAKSAPCGAIKRTLFGEHQFAADMERTRFLYWISVKLEFLIRA
jgi:hypothetical protein